MDPHLHLSRRERQIMDALFAEGELTINQLRDHLPDPPTPMAIRNMVRILDEKGLLLRRKVGREFHYRPRRQRARAGQSALKKVLNTFFDDSIEKAMGAYLADRSANLSDDERQRLHEMIDAARKRGE
ncbi:BlaI/MecI/CopY family transcriptional regulator [Phycisphaerales bacterium AB-hyl4]|uniref:BlaI/MecI/CopY family transcriptional regulator n=1 Tax=Natronomicrosphaera hydrolytica TaxID=3242702 RepID=A0ABV4U326_9BACT